MNPSVIEGRRPRARPNVPFLSPHGSSQPFSASRVKPCNDELDKFPSKPKTALERGSLAGLMLAAAVLLGSCSYLERGRQVADVAVATAHHANLAALVAAQEERIRLRKSRCYNPMLTPATIADAALDPRLGAPWVEELLRDCPKFAAFIAQLVVSRTQLAGLMPPQPEAP